MDNLLERLVYFAYSHGKTIVRSGKSLEYYLDMPKAYGSNPVFFNKLVDKLRGIVDNRTTCIVGYGNGSIPLATAIYSRHGKKSGLSKLTILREKKKKYGKKNQIDGHIPTADDFLTIVDGVVTTGGSLCEATALVEPTGASILGYAVVVDRRDNDSLNLRFALQSLYIEKEIIIMARALNLKID